MEQLNYVGISSILEKIKICDSSLDVMLLTRYVYINIEVHSPTDLPFLDEVERTESSSLDLVRMTSIFELYACN